MTKKQRALLDKYKNIKNLAIKFTKFNKTVLAVVKSGC